MAGTNDFPSYAATSNTPHRSPLKSVSTPEEPPITKRILLLGLRRAGKTSIQQVLFNALPPKQTFYLETTMRITKHVVDTVTPLEIWDCPGNITVETLGAPLSQFATIIFVIDIRDLYNQAISKFVDFITPCLRDNPTINLEVFVHKAEKLQEDDKIENFRQIHERVSDRLTDMSPEYEQMQPNFYLTSVYDHSLHEAFSKVLQKLTDCLPHLEDLLNVFCANSQSPKAFLFDTRSRLYLATDASPVDTATHNLCCDYLQMLSAFGPLYRSATSSPMRPFQAPPLTPPPSASSSTSFRHHTPSPSPPSTEGSSLPTTPPTPSSDLTSLPPSRPKRQKELFYPSAATTLHPLSPGTTMTYHMITKNLALVALIPANIYKARRGLLEYNVVFFREGVQEICDLETEVKAGI